MMMTFATEGLGHGHASWILVSFTRSPGIWIVTETVMVAVRIVSDGVYRADTPIGLMVCERECVYVCVCVCVCVCV